MEDIKASPYLLGISTAIFMYAALFFIKKLLGLRAEAIKKNSLHRMDDILVYTLSYTTHLFMIVSALYVGFQFFPEHKTYPTWSWRIFFSTLMLQVGIWGSYAIKRRMQISFARRRKRDPASASSINIVELMLKFAFLSLVLMFTLNNLGIKVTTMIAGLGIGGVAIALAMQNILGDLFSSLSIILDKPFVVGDFIILGEWMGEVEHIGLKTTRIRSLNGEQIIISNSDLLSSRIRNMKRMHERRNSFSVSLPHETDPKTIRRAVEIITGIVSSRKQVRFERCHYCKITPSSLDIELVYFILSDDFHLHMSIQEGILLEIHQSFLEEGIRYATPVQQMVLFGPGKNAPRAASTH